MAQYTALDGENIYIVSNKVYGSVDYAFKLALDNGFTDLTADIAGVTLEYDSTIKADNVQTLVLKSKVETGDTVTFTGRPNMSIFDVVNCTTGDLESVISLVVNSDMENISDLISGKLFTYQLTNNAIKQYADRNRYVYATGSDFEFNRYSAFSSGFNQKAFL